ncbi:MAG: hypothetical protein Q9168_004177 [Polycauliona sp. 1 TL-2023]
MTRIKRSPSTVTAAPAPLKGTRAQMPRPGFPPAPNPSGIGSVTAAPAPAVITAPNKRTRRPEPADNGKDSTAAEKPLLTPGAGDETEDEGPPKKKLKARTEVIRGTDYNLRPRSAYSSRADSPFLAPWQRTRLQNRQARSGMVKRVSKVPVAPNAPVIKAPTSSGDDSAHARRRIGMALPLARVLHLTDVPCTSPECPIKGPHGEGPYLYPVEVPNSDLANVHFAPSIPPPAVVNAFNSDRPGSEGEDIQRAFHKHHVAPCKPSKHLGGAVGTLACTSEICGVEEPHKKGAYLHEGLDPSISQMRRSDYAFGISNPPPEIWEAWFRIMDNTGTEYDAERFSDFSAHHAHFTADEKSAEDLAEFRIWQEEWKSQRS